MSHAPVSTRIAVTAAALSDDPREATKLSRQLGFGGVMFEAHGSRFKLEELSVTGRREFLRTLASQDQQLVGFRTDLGPKGFGPGADVDRLIDRLGRVLEAAAGARAPLISLNLGPLPSVREAAKPRPRITREQAGLILLPTTLDAIPAPDVTTLDAMPPAVDPTFVAQVDAAVMELGRQVDRFGVTVALHSDLSSFAALDRVLRQANCPHFAVELDPAAALTDDWSLDDTFSSQGPLIRHVRGRDAVTGVDHRHTRSAVVGQGGVDWEHLLSNLESADYQGWITVDPLDIPERSAAAATGLRHLRKLRETRE